MNVLITGASSGIGEELTKIFVDRGHKVIAVARREGKLLKLNEKLVKNLIPISKDISKIKNIDKMYEYIKNMGIEIDLLINNAGVGEYGYFWETEIENEMKMIDLNIKALTYLSKKYMADMKRRNSGGIINVASTAAFQSGGPLMSVYYATKSYVLSFTEGLIGETEGSGVRVMALCPGPTSTEFKGMKKTRRGIEKLYITTPQEVARCCYEAYFKGKEIEVPGKINRILEVVGRLLPGKIQRRGVKKFQEKKKRL